MRLSRSKTKQLKALGWSVVRQKSRRPQAISPNNVLDIGRDLSLDDADTERVLVELDTNR